jgi:hypothetical protein
MGHNTGKQASPSRLCRMVVRHPPIGGKKTVRRRPRPDAIYCVAGEHFLPGAIELRESGFRVAEHAGNSRSRFPFFCSASSGKMTASSGPANSFRL